MTTYYVFIAVAFILFLALSLIDASFSARNHEGTPNSVGPLKLMATLLATAIGGGLIFGLIGFGQTSGTIGILLGAVYALSFTFLGMLSPVIRRACLEMVQRGIVAKDETLSVPLLLARKYNRYSWGLIMSAFAVAYIGFLSAQYVACSQIVTGMGVDIPGVTYASAACVLLYTSIAGYKAVLRSDLLQLAIVLVILVVSIFVILLNGGLNLSTLPADYWNPVRDTQSTSNFVWLAVFVFPSLLLRIDHWQRIITAKTDRDARVAYIAAGCALLAVFAVLIGIGAAGTIAGESSPFYLYDEKLLASGSWPGKAIHALVLTGMLCAVISSADTILNAGASAVTQTLRAWRVVTTKSALPVVLTSIVMSALALGLAQLRPDVVKLITEGFKVMTILLPAIIAALVAREPSDKAASTSVIAGLLTYLLMWMIAGLHEWAYVVGFATATVTFLVVARLDSVISQHVALANGTGRQADDNPNDESEVQS